jgi:DNA-binding SARP family transcriptional activator
VPLAVRTLGSFAVVRQGTPLAVGDWYSRKVRDLFKILVSRQGRAFTRDAALELLWPEATGAHDEVQRSRLSVTLSTLRKVLDPDKDFAPDHYLVADRRALSLRVEHVVVDVTDLLRTVRSAQDAIDRGDWSGADQLLRAPEATYPGDFLEEDLYEDWAVDCREVARSAAVTAARLRVECAQRRGDTDGAARHLESLLRLDPYDEPAWLTLLAALHGLRRHGEVRRHHARYARRMREIGVTPQPL